MPSDRSDLVIRSFPPDLERVTALFAGDLVKFLEREILPRRRYFARCSRWWFCCQKFRLVRDLVQRRFPPFAKYLADDPTRRETARRAPARFPRSDGTYSRCVIMPALSAGNRSLKVLV
jgi:hypothetical protein